MKTRCIKMRTGGNSKATPPQINKGKKGVYYEKMYENAAAVSSITPTE